MPPEAEFPVQEGRAVRAIRTKPSENDATGIGLMKVLLDTLGLVGCGQHMRWKTLMAIIKLGIGTAKRRDGETPELVL